MFWVLIYIATKFLSPIPLILARIDDFLFQFLPKLTNSSSRISQKSASQKKLAHRLKPDHPQVNTILPRRAPPASLTSPPVHVPAPQAPSPLPPSHRPTIAWPAQPLHAPPQACSTQRAMPPARTLCSASPRAPRTLLLRAQLHSPAQRAPHLSLLSSGRQDTLLLSHRIR
jgi:hypothetical protein